LKEGKCWFVNVTEAGIASFPPELLLDPSRVSKEPRMADRDDWKSDDRPNGIKSMLLKTSIHSR
jgi:hypothetical protein